MHGGHAGIALGCLALVGSACFSPTDVLLDLPVAPSIEAIILALAHDQLLELHAIPVTEGSTAPLPGVLVRGDADLTVHALLYDVSLEELELDPGPIPLAREGTRARPLPPFTTAWRSELRGTSATPFAEATRLDGPVAGARIPAPDRGACLEAGGCYPGRRSCVRPCPEPPVPEPPEPPEPPEAPRDLDAITPPDAPALPELLPCAPGWIEVAPTEAGAPATCQPTSRMEPCPDGQLIFPGDEECSPAAGQCPNGQYPEELPPGEVSFVDPTAAPGGAGTPLAPFSTIGDALAAVSPGATIALARGVYREALVLADGITVLGPCREAELIAPAGAPTITLASGASAVLRGLSIRAPGGIAIAAVDGGRLELSRVSIEEASGAGISLERGASLDASELVVRGSRCALCAVGSGPVTLRRVLLEGNEVGGILSDGPGSAIFGQDVFVRDTTPSAGMPYSGVGVEVRTGGSVVLQRAAIERASAVGLYVTSGSATVSDAWIQGTRTTGLTDGRGVLVSAQGSLVLERSTVEGNIASGIYVEGRAELSDVAIERTRPNPSTNREGTGLVVSGAAVNARRVALVDNYAFGALAGGSRVELTDLTVIGVENTNPENSEGNGASLFGGTTATVTRALITRTRVTGLTVGSAGSSVVVRHLTVRDSRNELSGGPAVAGIFALDGAHLRVEDVEIAGAAVRGVLAQGSGTRLELLRTSIHDTTTSTSGELGEGLSATAGARVDARGVLLRRTGGVGLLAHGTGTVVAATDLAIDGVRESANAPGDGARVDGASMSITRARIGGAIHGVVAVGEGALELEDVEVADLVPPSIPGGSDGVLVTARATGRLTRLAIHRVYGRGLGIADAAGVVDAADLSVDTILRDPLSRDWGVGVGIFQVQARLARLAITRCQTAGLTVSEAYAQATDVAIVGSGESGVTAGGQAELTVDRLLISETGRTGIFVDDEGSIVSASDARIERTSYEEGTASSYRASGGFAQDRGAIELNRFAISDNLNFGLAIAAGRASLSNGAVTGNNIGVAILSEGFEVRQLLDAVRFGGNSRDLFVEGEE